MNAINILSEERNEEDVVDSDRGHEPQNGIVDIVFDNSRVSYQKEGIINAKPNFEVKQMVSQDKIDEEEPLPLPLQAVPIPT